MPDHDAPVSGEIDRARAALATGGHDEAANACARLLARYPAFAVAWRMLGDAERGRGDVQAAGRAYAAALARDPRSPEAWLGLGLLSEGDERLDDAVAYCQVAWELAPERGDLRETLERLAARRYGPGGALELSRPALATLHLRAGRPERAAREYHAALAQLPERIDLRLGLAESLWRLGLDDDARAASSAVLESYPEAALALLILAEIERRGGDGGHAASLAGRLRAIDPDGALVADAAERHPGAALGWLAVRGAPEDDGSSGLDAPSMPRE